MNPHIIQHRHGMAGWRLALTVCLTVWQVGAADAADDWRFRADLQGAHGSYSGSVQRKSLDNAGVILHGDYLEQGGFSLGTNLTRLKYKSGFTLKQQSFYGSLRWHLYFDALPGRLSLMLDGHAINNNDPTGDTDNVRVFEPRIAFLNFDKTFYLDVALAQSRYRNNLTVRQWSGAAGFGFNRGADWVQARGYWIRASNAARAQNKRRTVAVDVKWTHWFAPGSGWIPEKATVAVLAGERIYAVDADAAMVYNLADIQRGSASLALQWRLAGAFRLMLMGGNERYLNNIIHNSYDNRFVYADLSVDW